MYSPTRSPLPPPSPSDPSASSQSSRILVIRLFFGLVLFFQFSLTVCIVSFLQLPWGSLSLSMSSFHVETFLEHGGILGGLFILM